MLLLHSVTAYQTSHLLTLIIKSVKHCCDLFENAAKLYETLKLKSCYLFNMFYILHNLTPF